jgi:hypothetical protein
MGGRTRGFMSLFIPASESASFTTIDGLTGSFSPTEVLDN